jgi:hypothetical protein
MTWMDGWPPPHRLPSSTSSVGERGEHRIDLARAAEHAGDARAGPLDDEIGELLILRQPAAREDGAERIEHDGLRGIDGVR